MVPTMSSTTVAARASRSADAQRCGALAAIGAWTAVVPYVARLLGLTVDVPARVEVVDHVIPGLVVAASALYLLVSARRGVLRDQRFALPAAGLCFLAGFWVLATHAPLIGDAARSAVSWEAAIWHSISALPMLIVAAWCVVRSIPDP